MKEPEERSYNLFNGQQLNQRVSPAKDVVPQYPERSSPNRPQVGFSPDNGSSPQPGAAAHGRRAGARVLPEMHTGRDSVISRRYREESEKGRAELEVLSGAALRIRL